MKIQINTGDNITGSPELVKNGVRVKVESREIAKKLAGLQQYGSG